MKILTSKKYEELKKSKEENIRLKQQIKKLQSNKKCSETLLHRNQNKRKREKKLTDMKISSLEKSIQKKDELLEKAREVIVKLNKSNKPSVEDLKREKMNKTDTSKICGSNKNVHDKKI